MRYAATLFLSTLLFAAGCERLVDSGLNTHGKTESTFPADINFEALHIASGDRLLAANFVQAKYPRGPLMLIFHGDGEAVGDWSDAQTFLAKNGFDSLVFDYSGYGNSSGKPTIDHLREDALAAYARANLLSEHRSGKVFIVAHSLGCNVALDAASSFRPRPSGFALWGATPSLREFVTHSGTLPKPLIFLIPDRWDNVKSVANVREPLIILHGSDDRVTTAEGARRIADHAVPLARVIEIPGAGHNALYKAPDITNWSPIFQLARP